MLSDSMVAVGSWRRLVPRLAFMASLTAAAFVDIERLLFVLIILPVIVLFFLVLGPLGRAKKWSRCCGARAGDHSGPGAGG